MKVILIVSILTSAVFGQANPGIDMEKLAKTLRLEGTELRIEDVTQREAQARKLPLESAWIVSAPEHELFFPLVIYTAPKGVLHTAKHEALRKAIREKPLKEGDFGYGLGFFDAPKIGECFVFMEEILISSNNPPRVRAGMPLPAWRPTSETVLSIIGTPESANLDFQIAVISPNEDELGDFPGFKNMLYGPDFLIPKELAADMVELVRDSSILIAAKDRPDKRLDNDTREEIAIAEDLTPLSSADTKKKGKADVVSADTGLPLWAWLLGVGTLFVTLFLVQKGIRRSRNGNR